MADRGDAEALRQMGYRQLLGQGLDADGGAAAAAFAAAAAAGDPYALFNEGYMAFQGQHMPKNYTLAKLRFHQAAVLGIHAAYNGLGAVYYHGDGNFTMARYYFEKGVELGDQDSMFNLATMYKDGIIAPLEGSSSGGGGRNVTYAVDLYNLAESQGHWRSSQELTKIYTYGVPGGDSSSSSSSTIGNIIEKNYTRAFISYDKFTRNIKHWRDGLKDAAMVYLEDGDAWGAGVRYALLAEQGCPEAMLNLGWLMAEKKEVMGIGGGGDGGPGELFRRAGELGKSQGWLLAGHHMMTKMHGGGNSGSGDTSSSALASVSASLLLAVEYYHKAGNMSNVEALYTLGWLYEQGSHVMSYPHPHHLERDVDIARQYYREAVDVSVAFRYAVAPWLAMITLDMRMWGRETWEGLGHGVQQMMMQWDVVVLMLLCVILVCVLYLKMKKKKKRIREEGESVSVVHGGSG
jgi:SEL1 protein